MYYKILNEQENHNGYQYKAGLNILNEPFNRSGDCEPGGFYITDLEHIACFLGYGTKIAEIELPENTKIYENPSIPKKWKVNQLIIGKTKKLTNKKNLELLAHCKKLQSANLAGSKLQYAQLQGVDLQSSYLKYANLQGTNLEGANLEGANLKWTNLRYANLEGAKLEGTELRYSNLEGAIIDDNENLFTLKG